MDGLARRFGQLDPDRFGDFEKLESVDHRPAGQALFGVGVAGLSIGAALLVTDLVLRARKRERASERVWVPWVSGGVAGLGVVQRF